jgi:opacity protein-like surface antigen
MRITLFATLMLVFFWAAPVRAQEDFQKFELYGGFDFLRVNFNAKVSGQPLSASFNGYGGGGNLEYNVNNWVGVVGDLEGNYFPEADGGADFSYLFGPRVNFRRGRVMPFAQAVFEGIATTDTIGGGAGYQNVFGLAAGGGVDIRVSSHFAIRPAQAEYLLTKLPDGLNNRQNNFRFSSGVVFLFGGK